MKLIGYYKYRNIPTAIYLTREEWYKGYCATSSNGVEVEWAEIFVGTKDAPSALHVAVILLHELGHLAERATFTPAQLKKDLTMVFKERLHGPTNDVLAWYLQRELVAWSFAYVFVKYWKIPEEIFEEAVKICTGKRAQWVMDIVKKIEGVLIRQGKLTV
jgi:hypothetical protein